MPLMFQNGQLLFRNGVLAMSADCCCHEHGSDSDSDSDTDCLESRCKLKIEINYSLNNDDEIDSTNESESRAWNWAPSALLQIKYGRTGDSGLQSLAYRGNETESLTLIGPECEESDEGSDGDATLTITDRTQNETDMSFLLEANLKWPGIVKLSLIPECGLMIRKNELTGVTYYPGLKYTNSIDVKITGCGLNMHNPSVSIGYSTSNHQYTSTKTIDININ